MGQTESSLAKQRVPVQRVQPAGQVQPAVIWNPSSFSRMSPRPVMPSSNSSSSIGTVGSRTTASNTRLRVGTPPPQDRRARLLGLNAAKVPPARPLSSALNTSSMSAATLSSQFDDELEHAFQVRM